MILIPNIDGCTIITNNGLCSILGHPFDIVPSLFVKRDKIDDTTTLISKTVKEVSVLEGNFHSEYYIELLKNLFPKNIQVKFSKR